MRRLLFLGLVGCGRIDFDASPTVDAVDARPADLLLHYTLDTDLSDASGNGHHGMCNTTCPGTAPGRFGQAIELDGIDNAVVAPDLRPVPMTLSAWVYRTRNAPVQNIISKVLGTTTQNSWQLVIDSDATLLVCNTQQDLVGTCTNSSATVALNQWQHVAYVSTGTEYAGFLNGVEFFREALSLGYDTHPILIGMDSDNGVFFAPLQGRIDDVRIYTRAFTPSEIAALAAGQEP